MLKSFLIQIYHLISPSEHNKVDIDLIYTHYFYDKKRLNYFEPKF